MITNDFKGISLSRLGFGTMRLPLLDKNPGSIDEAKVDEMIDFALSHGINYFDTAHPYHDGMSERVIGRSLSRYPRDSYYLATKYPGHQIASSYDPEAIFEEQIGKCGVDYFDFYLLHNVYENSIATYLDPRWGILPYFLEQKKKGRIRHLGFSCHGKLPLLREFLDAYGSEMEFCQIQLNYLDWTLQSGKEKVDLLAERGIDVWVMEPVRGGTLAKLPEAEAARLHAMRPDESVVAWAFRFLQDIPSVKMILSGMSNLEQMQENVATFEEAKPLSEEERSVLLDVAETLKGSVPCTACRYCCAGCPKEIDIPTLIAAYNDIKVSLNINVAMGLGNIPKDKREDACIACGACAAICPQGIDVPTVLRELKESIDKLPSWEEICRKREEAALRNRKG